jgi:hypothetical protein
MHSGSIAAKVLSIRLTSISITEQAERRRKEKSDRAQADAMATRLLPDFLHEWNQRIARQESLLGFNPELDDTAEEWGEYLSDMERMHGPKVLNILLEKLETQR